MDAPPMIVVVDDDEAMRDSCRQTLERSGYRVATANDAFSAVKAIHAHAPDLVILDLKMPGVGGTDLLRKIRGEHPGLDVVVITGYSSVESAVECMRLGAYDYLPKPFDTETLRLVVRRAVEKSRLAAENEALRRTLAAAPPGEVLLGESAAMRRVRELVDRVAASDTTVLVTGESGTGKELVARAIHRGSARRERPFVAVDCASFVETLCESELFGHVKGAFTGATASRPGRFELAHGGTVFLDEVANVPPAVQAKLLRVLQEREVTRVGDARPIAVDVRIVAATNRDLAAAMKEARFREDLFYRLSVVTIGLPPLRARRDDIPLLAEGLLRRIQARRAVAPRPLSAAALAALQEHEWPGNVRELDNTLERALVLAQGAEIGPEDLDLAAAVTSVGAAPARELTLAAAEAEQIRKVLDLTAWHVGQAAALLGIDRKTLWRKIRTYRLREEHVGHNATPGAL
ncbi:MAG TPA: sigma-54 dependent transcriptional regulator [Thermoanaerobaculaceae bacterium]|nr:sigma-54 dependent transcriptional regulator [Thermoanaerobaculaceae bacterium]